MHWKVRFLSAKSIYVRRVIGRPKNTRISMDIAAIKKRWAKPKEVKT